MTWVANEEIVSWLKQIASWLKQSLRFAMTLGVVSTDCVVAQAELVLFAMTDQVGD